MGQFGLQPVERFAFVALLVAADQIADILAYVLVITALAHIGAHVFAERSAETHCHRCCSRHGVNPSAIPCLQYSQKRTHYKTSLTLAFENGREALGGSLASLGNCKRSIIWRRKFIIVR